MNVFGLLTHIGIFIKAGKDIDDVVQNILHQHEKYPSQGELMTLIADVSALLAAGLINLSADELKTVQAVIDSITAEVATLAHA